MEELGLTSVMNFEAIKLVTTHLNLNFTVVTFEFEIRFANPIILNIVFFKLSRENTSLKIQKI